MSLEEAKKLLNKKLGSNFFESFSKARPIEAFSTGNILIDYVCGVGGFPRGRLIELAGLESSGKTSIAILAAANCQKKGGRVLFLDYENSFNAEYAEMLGLNVKDEKKFLYAAPPCLEDGGEIIRTLTQTKEIDFIILDSIAAAPSRSVFEGEIGKAQIGVHARTVSLVLQQILKVVEESNACLVLINQLRTNIGVMYGDNKVSSGGLALKFYASLRLQIRIAGKITDKIKNPITGETKEAHIGNELAIKAVKNKVANPYREAKVNFYFGKGIDESDSLLQLSMGQGICKQAGAYYDFGTFGKMLGKDKATELIRTNPELKKQITDKLSEIVPVGLTEEDEEDIAE